MRGRNGLKWKFSLQTISGLTCKERERSHAERSHLEPFDFAPFDFAIRLQLWIAPRSHRERLSENPEPFDFAPFNFAVRLWLRIAPRSHPSTSLANPEPRFDRIWWIFFWLGFVSVFIYWEMVLYICWEAEKMWRTRRKRVFYIIFSNTTKH